LFEIGSVISLVRVDFFRKRGKFRHPACKKFSKTFKMCMGSGKNLSKNTQSMNFSTKTAEFITIIRTWKQTKTTVTFQKPLLIPKKIVMKKLTLKFKSLSKCSVTFIQS